MKNKVILVIQCFYKIGGINSLSEEKSLYITSNTKYPENILWLAKRFKDLIKDIDKLEAEDQIKVINRLNELDPDLLNILKNIL